MYARCLDPSVLAFGLTSHRHPPVCILFISRLTSYNKQKKVNIDGVWSDITPTPIYMYSLYLSLYLIVNKKRVFLNLCLR